MANGDIALSTAWRRTSAVRKIVARLERGSGYFYFFGGDAADWIDRTVPGTTVGARTLEQWLAEFVRLKKLNGEIMKGSTAKGKAARKRTKP
jgi:hypothetical protein